jgi:hypothetical protein
LADFRTVEENFRRVAREVQQRQLEANVRRGEIVRHVLDADEALRDSDQGRSFYAFWQFLMSQQKQDELRQLLDQVLIIPPVAQTSPNEQRLLRHLKRSLIDAGSKIVTSNRLLAEQLRKLLDEQNVQEARRVRELVAEIKQLAVQVVAEEVGLDRREQFMGLSGLPEVGLPLARPLWQPTAVVDFAGLSLDTAVPALDATAVDSIYQQFFIDEATLYTHIENLLEEQTPVSLATVLHRYPLQKGLAELLTYVNLAARFYPAGIDPSHTITVSLRDDPELPTRQVQLPQILFG